MTRLARPSLRAFAVALATLGFIAGCTSFSFKKSGRGAAPGELKDRSVMVKIPGGVFEMGAPSSEPDEYPPHKVDITGFLIDKTEVTIGDYDRCVQARACRAPNVNDPSEDITSRHPVVGVSWYDANKYCEWVGKRLPTEAEWELAARAPRFTAFPWDGRFDPTKANTRGEADGYSRTAPVGSFPKGASGYGLLDMAGNAAEWTSDWYETTYYQKSAPRDPKGPETPTGTKSVRGGSWSDNDYLVRSTARVSFDPNLSNDGVGFRCAADR
jgi:formylglycine-generating enzyme required for sulfatase activity